MLLPFQGATAPTRDTQGVASLALGYVLHWAFSPPLLNPKLEYSNNIFSPSATYITNHKLQVQAFFSIPTTTKKADAQDSPPCTSAFAHTHSMKLLLHSVYLIILFSSFYYRRILPVVVHIKPC